MSNPPTQEPIAYGIVPLSAVLGLGKTKIYEMIGSGQLEAMKAGRRTLVSAASVRRYLDSLPRLAPKAGA